MFRFSANPVGYTDPWASSVADRFANFLKRDYRIVYLYEKPDNSTFRYRVYNMIQALDAGAHVSATYFTADELEWAFRAIELAHAVVVCRFRYTDELNRLISTARAKGKPVFFDVDDLVFDTAYTHLILNTLDQDLRHPNVWDHWFAYIGRIGASLSLCDAVITTNEYLAHLAHGFSKKPTYVIPNFLNVEQLRYSSDIIKSKRASSYGRDGSIHIGYFSGTPTHTKDFGVVADFLAQMMANNDRLILRVVGFMEIDVLRPFAGRVERFSLQDFLNLQRLVAEVELNIVPLVDNVFSNCKSELKYFEAAIAGTVTIATPTFTYRKAITDGVNGYLARSFEWDEKIEAALASIDKYEQCAERAFEHAEATYSFRCFRSQIERTLLETHPLEGQTTVSNRLQR